MHISRKLRAPVRGAVAAYRKVAPPGLKTAGFSPAEEKAFTKDQYKRIGTLTGFTAPIAETDFKQRLCNCYAMATWMAVARNMPGRLESMVRDLGGGQYEVTFAQRLPLLAPVLGSRPHRVVVDAQLPRAHVLTRRRDEDGRKDLLMPLIEKAYAKWHGSYAAMEWGSPATALAHATGEPTKHLFLRATSDRALFKELSRAVRQKRPTVALTLDVDGLLPKGMRPGTPKRDLGKFTDEHCYELAEITGTSADDCVIHLRDPRHPDKPHEISMETFRKAFALLFVSHARGDRWNS